MAAVRWPSCYDTGAGRPLRTRPLPEGTETAPLPDGFEWLVIAADEARRLLRALELDPTQ